MSEIDKTKSKASILVVDDGPTTLHLLVQVLGEEGYSVRPAPDGKTALQFVEHTIPDLVLLDINMPGMDGYEVCRRLKASEATQDIPVIFLSAMEESIDKVRAFEAGGVDFVTKPFEVTELLARIETHIALHDLQQNLEGLVRERTEELAASNEQLREEIAERVQAGAALRESEQQLSVIYDSVGDVLYHLAVEPNDCYRFLSVNQTFLEATGLTEDQIVGKRIEEVIPEPAIWMVKDNYKKAIDEMRIVRWEETSVYPTGEKVGEVSIAPVRNEEGICSHLVGSVHDITERVQAQEASRESEARFKQLAEAVDDVFVLSDVKDWSVLYANSAYEKVWGRPLQHLYEDEGQWDEGIHPDDRVRVRESWERMVEQGEHYEEEYRVIHPESSMRWVRSRVYPVRDQSGQLYRIAEVVQDITARKAAELELQTHRDHLEELVQDRTAELAQERNLLRMIMDHLPDHVFVKDSAGRYLVSNQAHAHFVTGSNPDSLVGKTAIDLYPEELATKYGAEDRGLFDSGEPLLNQEEDSIGSDGTQKTLLTTKVPLHNPEGDLTALIGISRDITESKETERLLLESRTQLQNILDTLPVSVSVKDMDGRYLVLNRPWEDITGNDRVAAIGRTAHDVYPGELAGYFQDNETQALTTLQPVTIEETLPTTQGERTFITTHYPLFDTTEQPYAVCGASIDIAARKQAEDEVQRSVRHCLRRSPRRSTLLLTSKKRSRWRSIGCVPIRVGR